MLYLESPSTDPHYNLALEQYAFDILSPGQDVFMLWQNDNAIIVGKYQNTAAEINADFVAQRGIRVVRRLSGGGAVYHDLGNLNYTFIARTRRQGKLDFEAFCRPVVDTLRRFGVNAELSGRNDLTIGGKKFSGSAQYVKDGRVMHHGTILYASDLSVLAGALRVSQDKIESKGVKSVRSRVTNVADCMPVPVPLDVFKKALAQQMGDQNGLEPKTLAPAEQAAVLDIQKNRYGLWEWNYGASPKHALQKSRRIEGCGTVSVHMEVEKGRLTAFKCTGDFFCSGELAELESWMLGQSLEKQALEKALAAMDTAQYINGMSNDAFARLLTE